MARSDDYAGGKPLSAATQQLQQYSVRTAKAVLCIACWSGVFALFVTYGPATMRVSFSPVPTRPYEIVTAVLGVVLSGGVSLLLTIVVVILVVIGLDWQHNQRRSRNRRSDNATETEIAPDATESVEEKSHA